MEKLSKKFKIHQNRASTLIASAQTLIGQESKDLSEIEHCLEQLEHYYTVLSGLSDEIIDTLVETADDQFSTEHSSEILSFIEEVARQRKKLQTYLAQFQSLSFPASEAASTVIQRANTPRLPKLELPRFSGDPLKWNAFWDSFQSAVHNNHSLSSVEKFNYLNSLLKGSAADATAPISVTNDNYQTAVEIIQERFGKQELIISAHVDALLKIPAATGSVSSLRKVYDLCEIHIGGLRARGIESEMYGVIVAPIILSKLPEEVKLVLTRKDRTAVWKLDDLRVLLREEVETREWVSDSQRVGSRVEKPARMQPKYSTSVVSGPPRRPSCAFCGDNAHPSWNCLKIKSVEDRLKKAKELRLCFNCLKSGHGSSNCQSKSSCRHCNKRHHTALCYISNRRNPADASPPSSTCSTRRPEGERDRKTTAPTDRPPSRKDATNASAVVQGSNLVLQTASVGIENPVTGQSTTARVIFDQGSHRSFIRQDLVTRLGLQLGGLEKMSVGSFRSEFPEPEDFSSTKAYIRRLDGQTQPLHAVVVPDVIVSLAATKINSTVLESFGDVPFADNYDSQEECVNIEILIGIDHYWEFVSGQIIRSPNGLTAMESSVGWLLSGHDQTRTGNQLRFGVLLVGATNRSPAQCIERLWRLDAIGIKDEDSSTGDLEEEVLHNFNKTIEYKDSRYHVNLPGNGKEEMLPTNLELCRKRIKGLIRRLRQSDRIKAYDDVINDQIQRGFIEKVGDPERSRGVTHYISHHPVIKADHATTKLRIVYDCSAKSSPQQRSLNDCLHTGASLIDNQPAILVRFRSQDVAIIADIEKAFLQVALKEVDRDATRFLWLRNINGDSDSDGEVVYRFRRVLFGASSSPFLLGATIKYHLEKSSSPAASKMHDNFYVDNLVTGCDNVQTAKQFYTEAKQVMIDAGMNLREWQSNSSEVLQYIPEIDRVKTATTGVLGVIWNTEPDKLSVKNVKYPDMTDTIFTKRKTLQILSKVFDPLGFVSPITIKGKILMQDLWVQKLDWDASLKQPEVNRLRSFIDDISMLEQLKIPRRCWFPFSQSQLHVFVDASTKAYAVVAYLVGEHDSQTHSTFVMSKTRVAPLKQLTVPKLELMAAYLGAKTAVFIQKNINVDAVHLWSDYQIVISWIRSKKPLQPFVQNRVRKIKEVSMQVHYCPSTENVADLPSRGTDISTLMESKIWIHGPTWLTIPSKYPEDTFHSPDYYEPMTTTSIVSSSDSIQSTSPFDIDIEKLSSLTKLLRITSYCNRFVKRTRHKSSFPSQALDKTEVQESKLQWELHIQRSFFNQEAKTSSNQLLRQLSLFKDDKGLYRSRCRIDNADVSYNVKFPKFLPKNNPFTALLVRHVHENLLHQGLRHTVLQLRQEYWIPQMRQVVKAVISKCVQCRMWDARPYKLPDPPPLPSLRVTEKPPFSYVGCDFAGPLYHRVAKGQFEKCYICIFTCAVIRAVHLELLHSLSTEDFLMGLRRFISRRGTPEEIVSDNAKTFVTASMVLEELWNNVIQDESVLNYIGNKGIKWRFNAPRAPWWGGFFERLIRSVKSCLRKTLGRSTIISFPQLQTLLIEIEGVLNSRPLMNVYDDVDHTKALTPSDFLNPGMYNGFPTSTDDINDQTYTEVESSSKILLKKLQHQHKALNKFWTYWRSEYLTNLREFQKAAVRSSSSPSPTPGDVVLIKEDAPRGQWKMAVITKLLIGADGKVRAATVKGMNNYYVRPINLLVPLEVRASAAEMLPSIHCENPNPDPVVLPNGDPIVSTNRPLRAAATKARSRICNWIRQLHDDDASSSSPPECV